MHPRGNSESITDLEKAGVRRSQPTRNDGPVAFGGSYSRAVASFCQVGTDNALLANFLAGDLRLGSIPS
jgi:hypothetical protein